MYLAKYIENTLKNPSRTAFSMYFQCIFNVFYLFAEEKLSEKYHKYIDNT
jgi:hypothetical protein